MVWWCGGVVVVWFCGVVWCGVVWCGVMLWCCAVMSLVTPAQILELRKSLTAAFTGSFPDSWLDKAAGNM